MRTYFRNTYDIRKYTRTYSQKHSRIWMLFECIFSYNELFLFFQSHHAKDQFLVHAWSEIESELEHQTGNKTMKIHIVAFIYCIFHFPFFLKSRTKRRSSCELYASAISVSETLFSYFPLKVTRSMRKSSQRWTETTTTTTRIVPTSSVEVGGLHTVTTPEVIWMVCTITSQR